MGIKILNKLKKERHRRIAVDQDIIIEELYRVFEKAVFHGGTAIWRCYKGGRFSEDIDVYIPRNEKKIEELFKRLEKRGFNILKKKISKNSLYSKLKMNRTIVRLEALFLEKQGILGEYETSEGNLITVFTLSPEEFVIEKTNAYSSTRKIRDLYDIYFLLRFVEDKRKIVKHVKKLVQEYKEPQDKEDIKALVLEGAVPDAKNMINWIRKWAKKNT